MDLLFLLPLFGALPNLIAFVAKLKPSVLSGLLISCATATLTVWSLLRGIVEIAGTDSPYIVLFLAAGALLYVAGLVIFTATAVRKK